MKLTRRSLFGALLALLFAKHLLPKAKRSSFTVNAVPLRTRDVTLITDGWNEPERRYKSEASFTVKAGTFKLGESVTIRFHGHLTSTLFSGKVRLIHHLGSEDRIEALDHASFLLGRRL